MPETNVSDDQGKSLPPCPAPPPIRLASRQRDGHKGDYGQVALIGGSRGMSGSIALSAMAALKSGSGLVTSVVPDCCLETVAQFHPAMMTIGLPCSENGRFDLSASKSLTDHAMLSGILDRKGNSRQALGVGPGMSTGAGSIRLVERCLRMSHLARVVDADAINVLSALEWATADRPPTSGDPIGPMVLTPHPGEFERMSGVPASDREGQVRAAEILAERTSVVIVLKGGPSVVVGPASVGQQVRYVNTTGNPGMATGGSGDVLTGIITGLLGQGLSPWDGARLGVWIHGLAGDLAAKKHGQPGMTALEILEFLPAAIQLSVSGDEVSGIH